MAESPLAVSVRASNANYDTVTCSYTLTITPRPITLAAESHEFNYTGAPQTWHHATSGTYGFIGSDTVNITFSEASVITTPSEGEIANVITAHSWPAGVTSGNYEVNSTYGQGVLTMVYGPAIELTITARDTAWIFDATTHTFHSFTVQVGTEPAVTVPVSANGVYTFANGDKLTVTFDENSRITDYNTPGVPNIITGYTLKHGDVDVSAAYNVHPLVRGTLRITPRPITIKANSHEFTYTGAPQSDHGYTVVSDYSPVFLGSDTITAVIEGSIQYPSQSPVANEVRSHVFTHGIAANYDVHYLDGALTMGTTPQAITITAASDEKTYDGTPLTNSRCTLIIGDDTEHPITITNGTYNFSNGDVLTLNVTGSVTNVSDNASDNNVPTIVSILHGTMDVSSLYTPTLNPGTLTINAIASSVTVNVTGHTDEVTYDAAEHTVTGYDLACENALFNTGSVSYSGTATVTGTNAGTYEMNLNEANFSSSDGNFTNVTFHRVADGQLVINQKAATVTAINENLTYDGTRHDAENTVTKDGFLGTDGGAIVTSCSGSITYPSQSPVTKTVTVTTGNANYDITTVPGQLTMTYGVQTELEITAASGTWTYDGNVHDTAAMIVKVGTADAVNIPNSNTYNIGTNGDVLTVVYNGSITHAAQSPIPNKIQSYTIKNNGTDVSGKYHVTLRDGSLTVNQKQVTITAASRTEAGGNAFTYTGATQTDGSYTVVGLVGSDALTATVTGSAIYPGTNYTNTVTSYSLTTGMPTDYSFA